MSETGDQPRGIMQAVAQVQRAVAVPKGRSNGKFSYRSFEDIVAALKEPCAEAGVAFTMTDEMAVVGDRRYVKATVRACLVGSREEAVFASAYAREADAKKGLDDSQLTGIASSYARKYALCGLFAIDGGGDPDQMAAEPTRHEPPASGPFTARCRSCGTRYQFASAEQYEAFAASPGCCPAPAWEVE